MFSSSPESSNVPRRVVRESGGWLSYEIDPRFLSRGSGDILGLLLGDDELEEVMFNGPSAPLMVYHRQHGMCRVNALLDEEYAWHFAREVAAGNGKSLDQNSPILDGALGDGSRINITIPPVAHHGISFTIRKFRKDQITLAEIIRSGGMPAEAAGFIWCCVDGLGAPAANFLVVGGTGSGKTTTLGALALLVSQSQRIVLIEDTPELQVTHPNAVRLVSKPGTGMDELMRGALRMRPDRIIVGEVRGAEALTLFEAMNTGHDGCAGTLHANSARESINRITSPPMAVPMSQLVGLNLVIVQARIEMGGMPRRVVTEISEIGGYGEGVVRMNKLFEWDPRRNVLVATGIPSRLRAKICQVAGLSAARFKAELDRRSQILGRLAASGTDVAGFLAATQI
jgi:flagellar protein FlaI